MYLSILALRNFRMWPSAVIFTVYENERRTKKQYSFRVAVCVWWREAQCGRVWQSSTHLFRRLNHERYKKILFFLQNLFHFYKYSKVSVCCGNPKRRKSPRSQMGKRSERKRRPEHKSGSSDGAQCSGHSVLPFIWLRVIYAYRIRRERMGSDRRRDRFWRIKMQKNKNLRKFPTQRYRLSTWLTWVNAHYRCFTRCAQFFKRDCIEFPPSRIDFEC